jgi:serine/threonine-protein kinase RsbW
MLSGFMTPSMCARRPDPPSSDRSSPPQAVRFERRFRSGDLETRIALAEVCARLAAAGIDEDDIGTVELVLAEVLNNISEHAYPAEGGPVALGVDLAGDALVCEVIDEGGPMPLGRVPDSALPEIAPPDHLPEGGFGWHIVRCLVSDLDYWRQPNGNRLRLRIPLSREG